MIIQSSRRKFLAVLGIAAFCLGVAAALHYQRLGLSLSHYDARGHLVVARRIFDSITPGWQQIGAVWLPLPHVLNALPVQIDAFYRTGASAIALSVIAFSITVSAVAAIVLSLSGSHWGALAAAALVALNPHMLYLQSTPMTEPLLFALVTLGVALLIEWSEPATATVTASAGASASRTERSPGPKRRAAAGGMAIGIVLALACLTRYEAWPITFTALGLAIAARWRQGDPLGRAVEPVIAIARYPAAAIVGFFVLSRITTGQWFVSGDFFVPENEALHHPWMAISQIAWGAQALHGSVLAFVSAAGCAWIVIAVLTDRARAHHAVAFSLLAGAAVPWLAFVQGHPYRIRYMVGAVAAEAIAAGVIAGLLARWSRLAAVAAAAALVIVAAIERHPFDQNGAMVVEAQWDRPNIAARQELTDCLRAGYAGESVMASMGSLGHYMQETSSAGFALRDFLHEGNGDIWLKALEGPRPFVGWILMEEKAEGGDMLTKAARANPQFLDGFVRVCEANGVALFRRQNRMLNVAR